jgi:hypothetical protein
VLGAGRWSGPRSRYDAPVEPNPAGDEPPSLEADETADPGTAWDALSRGEDPTR